MQSERPSDHAVVARLEGNSNGPNLPTKSWLQLNGSAKGAADIMPLRDSVS
jgi:hypothetical protein